MRNKLDDIFIGKVINIYQCGAALEDAVYEAFSRLQNRPDFESNKFFNSSDIIYIQKELAHAFGFDWTEFDELVFYNNNLKSLLNNTN